MGDGMDFSQITSHPNIIYVTAGTALVLILTFGKRERHVPIAIAELSYVTLL